MALRSLRIFPEKRHAFPRNLVEQDPIHLLPCGGKHANKNKPPIEQRDFLQLV